MVWRPPMETGTCTFVRLVNGSSMSNRRDIAAVGWVIGLSRDGSFTAGRRVRDIGPNGAPRLRMIKGTAPVAHPKCQPRSSERLVARGSRMAR